MHLENLKKSIIWSGGISKFVGVKGCELYIYIGSLGWPKNLIKWIKMIFCVNNLGEEMN